MDDTITQSKAESAARLANAADLWDEIWKKEGDGTWRQQALAEVYHRIQQIIKQADPLATRIVDVGGGRGLLADKFEEHTVTVVDHSEAALEAAKSKGHQTLKIDLESSEIQRLPKTDFFVSTEVLEHLSSKTRDHLLGIMGANAPTAIISVPNNRLGPDEEPQHTIKFTAMKFKRELLDYWTRVRIEVYGPFLLAICGEAAIKNFTLSVCLPVRDEGRDLEPTLASFRGVADELVVGIDPRTKDDTWQVAEEYADVVFHLDSPSGPPEQNMGPDGIHFSHVRNQCNKMCKSEWIFMTEGHERLATGQDTLLRLDKVVPKQARVGFVFREGNGQRWMFPWLYQNASDMIWKRPVHNVLDFPVGTYAIMLPQIRTLHERHKDRGAERAVQRKAQNRRQLMDDWVTEHNVNSLFYLGQEWRDLDPKRAISRLDEFLAVSNNGVQKYQARLILAKECMRASRNDQAKHYLLGCIGDDWARTEHWIWLGDIAMLEKEYEKAYRFYGYSSTTIGDEPLTMWWIDLCYYSYVPAQRLAMVCGELGRIDEALAWAKKVKELLPPDSPHEAFEEADSNIRILQEAIDAARKSS